MRYNLMENGGMFSGSHLNYLQLDQGGNSGLTASADIEFNTSYKPIEQDAGEGYQFYEATSSDTIASTTAAYNSMIASLAHGAAYNSGITESMSYLMHGSSASPDVTNLTGTNTVHNNYFDTTGAFGPFYPNSFTGWTLSNNIDMTSGNAETTNP